MSKRRVAVPNVVTSESSVTAAAAEDTARGLFWPPPMGQGVTVVALDTGEVVSTHRIDPGRGYWRNT